MGSGKAIFLEMRVLELGVNEFTLRSIFGAFVGDYEDVDQGIEERFML